MAQVTSILPRIFHWVFLILEGLFGLGALCILLAMLINPHIPPGAHFGPVAIDFNGQPGTVELRPANGDFDFHVSVLQGNLTFFVSKAGALVEVFKHYGLPMVLMHTIFFAALFDLLRRLFRNVGRGESFSRSTVRLVQWIAGLLIGFSFVSAFVEGLFERAVFKYLVGHAEITISGTPIHLPSPDYAAFSHGGGFPLGHPMFFTGLLVLALSEVFRQGLALRSENELTI